MNRRPFFSTLLLAVVVVVSMLLITAGLPTSSTGVTASGANGGDPSNAPARDDQSNSTSNSGPAPTPADSVLENAKPNDLSAPNAGNNSRTATDNPSAKIHFGRVESVDKNKHKVRMRDSRGQTSDVQVGNKTIYGKRDGQAKTSTFSDIKTGDELNYSIDASGHVDQLNWYNQKVR